MRFFEKICTVSLLYALVKPKLLFIYLTSLYIFTNLECFDLIKNIV